MSQSQSQYKQLVSNFRLSIRRRHIQQIFQTQRQLYLKQQIQYNKASLITYLSNIETRDKWINQTALKLTGFANQLWSDILYKLYYVVPSYQYQHEQWVKLGIFKAIAELFKEQYMKLKFGKIVANIMTDVLYLNSKNQNQRVIKSILELKYLDDLLILMMHNPETQHIRLMAISCLVAPSMRNYLINNGLVRFLIQQLSNLNKSKTIIKNSQFSNSILYLLFSLLKIHQFDASTYSKPKKSVILTLVPILNQQLQNNHNLQNLTLVLKSYKQICAIGKPQVYQEMIKYGNIFDRFVEFMGYQGRNQVRVLAVKVLSNFLMSPQIEHTRFLAKKNILDRICQAYKITGNKEQTKLALLSLITNFTADFVQFQELTLCHPIMNQIILFQAQSNNTQIRCEAIYIICNILHKLTEVSPLFTYIQDLKIIDVMISNLIRSDSDIQIIKQILKTWKQMLINSQSLNNMNNGRGLLWEILKNYYGVEEILQNLGQRNVGDQVQQEILEFLDYFGKLGRQ